MYQWSQVETARSTLHRTSGPAGKKRITKNLKTDKIFSLRNKRKVGGNLPLLVGTLSKNELRFCDGYFPICSQIRPLTFSSKMYFPGSLAKCLLTRLSSWKTLPGDWSIGGKKKTGDFPPSLLQGWDTASSRAGTVQWSTLARQLCLLGSISTT